MFAVKNKRKETICAGDMKKQSAHKKVLLFAAAVLHSGYFHGSSSVDQINQEGLF